MAPSVAIMKKEIDELNKKLAVDKISQGEVIEAEVNRE